ncbi:hypothetical protein GLA29479_2660 [Lysobacter antibioticus]|uniref:DUF802 domain-containing protein n=1 Tax=Lysobacter antibioticus TaxID=84531 RepID=UPI0007172F21|nr:DUF802 domain-containing protein [Lysobacter antibioticus]ALN63526.1 hypothetical protein GLA29479_2660 [Lysobacter antibioticus]
MFRNSLYPAVFLAGLLAVVWVGAGYVGSNALALSVASLIAVCYLAGGFELYRYRQATVTLTRAVAELSAPPSSLGDWLGRLHPSLRNAARLRIEGERVALPAPGLTPYLVGLLVLLGMLGTLLGMMTTLRGTGMALQSATDLQAIRESIAAPVTGLAFAFGTSIAGVAASAMLGLLSALCRRERGLAVQGLDLAIATTLRGHSQVHQREEAFKLLQRQTETMPALVDRLQAMMATIEQQSLLVHERQLAGQEAFHAKTEATYAGLATSVEQSLKQSIDESVRANSAALQPILDTTMAAIARETAAMAAIEQQSLLAHERQVAGQDAFHARTEAAYAQLAASVERSLKDSIGESVRVTSAVLQPVVETTMAAIARETGALHQTLTRETGVLHETVTRETGALRESVAQAVQQQVDGLSAGFATATATAATSWSQALLEQRQSNAGLIEELGNTLQGFSGRFDQGATGLLESLSTRFDASTGQAADAWKQALSQQLSANDEMAARNQQALLAAAATFEGHAVSLVGTLQDAHKQLQDALESRDQQRLAAWAENFGSMTAALGERWQQTGEQVASRQQEICDTLARTAQDISTRTQAQAQDTIAEITRLVDAASEAPKAAAEVIAELRQKLSDSMVRDTAMLDERNRLLATLETLLDAVNHASTEQRTAVDALVATSADLLDRVGTRFTDHIEAETGKLGTVGAQIAAGAVEVASLGDAFGAAVQQFGETNDKLAERLQGVEVALDKSLARSDEQLAYYVAQAKEVIDLSMLAQKQIIDDIHQLADRQASVGAQAA